MLVHDLPNILEILDEERSYKKRVVIPVGASTIYESLFLYLQGPQEANSSGTPLYTCGHVRSSGNVDLYIGGKTSSSGNIDLYLRGLDYSSGNIPLYIRGFASNSGNIPLYIHNAVAVGVSGDITLFIQSALSSSGDTPLYIKGLSAETLNLYLQGPPSVSGVGNIPLFIWSTSNSGIFGTTHLYLEHDENFADPSFSLSLFTKADPSTSSSSYMNLFLDQNTQLNNTVNLYLSNIQYSGRFDLYVGGAASTVISSGNNNINMFIQNKVLSNNFNLAISGGQYSSNSINLHMSGIGSSSQNVKLYSHGF